MSAAKSDTIESKSKQPTGSSKRKRKHSIKRNVVSEGNSDCNETPKSAKVEKTYGKKAKLEKGKQLKGYGGQLIKEEIHITDVLECKKEKKKSVKNGSGKSDGSDEKCLSSTDSEAGHCSSAKPQCQNCKFCSEHRVVKDNLNDSKDKHIRNKKKFTCEICAKDGSSRVYNSIEKHKHHMATVHEIYTEEIKRFECTDCPETVWFPTKSKFTYHLGTKHPGIMKFVCEVCTETFILKANYKSHMKSHNLVVQKKFSCDVCNGTFVNKAGYEAHKKRFPGPHIKQSCSHCGFSFSREKHMKNHRCKTLLLEAAAKANKTPCAQEPTNPVVPEPPPKPTTFDTDLKTEVGNTVIDKKTTEASTETSTETSTEATAEASMEASTEASMEASTETSTETDSSMKKPATEEEAQSNKRVIFHRIIPRRNQDPAVYKPGQVQAQNVPESVVVQELREIDLEGGTFIAASANEPEQQFIVRDLNGHILQLDINEAQQGEENQVYLADWNIVAPYVIREKSP